MSNATDLENWAGPFSSLAKALKYAELTWGCAECSLVWKKSAKEIYINDGVDPETGKFWKGIPRGAYVYP